MHLLQRSLLSLLKVVTHLLVKSRSIPADIESELGVDKSKPIVYLLHTHSLTDLIALTNATSSAYLPNPTRRLTLEGSNHRGVLYLQKPEGLFSSGSSKTNASEHIAQLLHWQKQHMEQDVQIVPVSIFWGRAANKEKTGWLDWLSEAVSPNWLRKSFIVLFLGRDNFVSFSKAVSSRQLVEQQGSEQQLADKLIRVAKTHFYRKAMSVKGPNIIAKSQLKNAILATDSVKNAIAEHQQTQNTNYQESKKKAEHYLQEIAATYNESTIRLGDRVLTWVWNKIYSGIQVKNADKIRELAQKGHEIVYLPCHRSHMDYLLLTYVIYREGLMTPHIAAGINLNFWPVGGIFRRGGAFFLRRTFAGNKLYTVVFREYLQFLFKKGFPVKFYPEGGRSRTGRLLPPKTGMLAMTIQAVLKGLPRPVTFVPVYLGYENVMELGSYLKELKGHSKKKESFTQVFRSLKKLKNYGQGYLTFGEPINVSQYLDQIQPDWREASQEQQKPSWLTPVVNQIADETMYRINQSASINGMAICAFCLLASPNKSIQQSQLEYNIDLLLSLMRRNPFSENIQVPDIPGKDLVRLTLNLGKYSVIEDDYGRIIRLDEMSSITQTYYRNNIQHLYAIPSLICAIVGQTGMETERLTLTFNALYPFLRNELFIYMDANQVSDYMNSMLKELLELGILVQEEKCIYLPKSSAITFSTSSLLVGNMQQTLLRYAICLTQLQGESQLERSTLEKSARKLANHLANITGNVAPEFYDKNLFTSFVNTLKENGWVSTTDSGLLNYDHNSAELLKLVLNVIEPNSGQLLSQLLMTARKSQ